MKFILLIISAFISLSLAASAIGQTEKEHGDRDPEVEVAEQGAPAGNGRRLHREPSIDRPGPGRQVDYGLRKCSGSLKFCSSR